MATTIAVSTVTASASGADAVATAGVGSETTEATGPAAIWGRLPPVRTYTV